jgi:hypothetical protein
LRILDANAPSSRHRDVGAERLRKGLIAAALVTTTAASACGGGEQEARGPIQREGPEEQILRVAKTWEARWEERGFRGGPGPISLFDNRFTSRIVLTRGKKTAKEMLTVDGTFKLKDGSSYVCQAQAETTVAVTFGERAGEAAVQLSIGGLRIPQKCDHPAFPEPELLVLPALARFLLRGDKLVEFEPATERHEFLPAD